MITIVQTYSALGNSTIEGIDIMAIKFKNIYQGVKKKQYDILDPRRTEFDTDFLEFMAKINGLEVSTYTYFYLSKGEIWSIVPEFTYLLFIISYSCKLIKNICQCE